MRGALEEKDTVIDGLLVDFETAKEHLAIRLWDSDSASEFLPGLVGRTDLIPGIFAMVVVDLPESVAGLSQDDVTRWKVTEQQIFDQALANLERIAVPNAEAVTLNSGAAIIAITSESICGGSWALRLDHFPQAIGTRGVLVSIPVRDMCMAIPINDVTVFEQLSEFIQLTRSIEEEGPGSVSNHVYWYHEGEYVDLPYTIEDEAIKFRPPEAFTDAVQGLSQ